MHLSQIAPKVSSRDFIVTPYYADGGDRMVPQMPSEGPCRGQDGEPCRLCVDHIRERKTGPEYGLTVVRCKTHKTGFTLYPPGHVPYGQQAILQVGPDGSLLHDEQGQAPESKAGQPFEATCFQAALDAACGKYWNPQNPQRGFPGPDRWWGTQRRQLDKAVRWFGLDPCSKGQIRELICSALAVDQLVVEIGARAVANSSGYRVRGEAVVDVLEAVDQQCILERLLLSGHIAGLWGRPLRWDGNARVLRSPVFPIWETFAQTGPGRPEPHPRK